MTKSKTGEQAVLSEFKPKKQNVVVTFRAEVLKDIINARQIRGIETNRDFFGPDFKDIKGYSLNGPYLIVQLHDDTQYVYPMSDVARLKLYITE